MKGLSRIAATSLLLVCATSCGKEPSSAAPGGAAAGGMPGAGGGDATSGTGGMSGSGGAGASGETGGTAGTSGVTTVVGGAGGSGGSVAGAGGAAATGGAAGASAAGAGGTAAAGAAGASAAGAGGTAAAGGAAGASAAGAGGSSVCMPPPEVRPTGSDWVNGTLTILNDNGAWSWYSDERAIVDTAGGKLVVGSVANSAGVGGSNRQGDVDVVLFDLATRMSERTVLKTLNGDDHNAPGLLLRPNGGYAAMYAGHNEDCRSYSRNYVNGAWTPERTFDWQPLGCNLSVFQKVTYSNLWYMAAQGRMYSFVRSIGTSPNLLVSSDQGATWTLGGRLTSTPQVGYVAGYYKYWGDGVDRIDFVGTEAHPRDFDNSLYHGYIKGVETYDSMGRRIDANLADATSPEVTSFTQVFKTGSTIGGVTLTHAWNIDLMRYDDGTIAALWKARVAGSNPQSPDHRLLYARFDGSSWSLTYLGKAGLKLYSSEQDYTGIGALHPDDPHTIFISSTYDPRDDTTTFSRHELFQGTTCDRGATWTWTPVTANSTRDNLRPIMPKWDADHGALLWWRGTYNSMYNYNTEVVGIISGL